MKSEAAQRYRGLAGQHRTLANLYDRCAAQQELVDEMDRYETDLKEARDELARLEAAIGELVTAATKKEP